MEEHRVFSFYDFFFLLSFQFHFIGTGSEILFVSNTVFKNCNSCIIEKKKLDIVKLIIFHVHFGFFQGKKKVNQFPQNISNLFDGDFKYSLKFNDR